MNCEMFGGSLRGLKNNSGPVEVLYTGPLSPDAEKSSGAPKKDNVVYQSGDAGEKSQAPKK